MSDTVNPEEHSEHFETPCTACSWTPKRQRYCGYKSTIKLFYEAGDRGAWSIGSKYILKDRGTSIPARERANTEFIQKHTTIPVANVVQEWTDNGRYMMLVERVPGKTLQELWPSMPQTAREDLARETVAYLAQLRDLTCPQMQDLDGGPLYNAFLFRDGPDTPHGPFSSDDELWEVMSASFQDVPDEVVSFLRSQMPPAAPWTFTHEDLTVCNIMVDPETYRLTAVIDWERSGYYPVWWQSAGLIGLSDDDYEWKQLLRQFMPEYSSAVEFYRKVHACRYRGAGNRERRANLWREAGIEPEPEPEPEAEEGTD